MKINALFVFALAAVVGLLLYGVSIPNSLGDTAGATGYKCSSSVTSTYIDFSCNAETGGDCSWSGNWDFNGISDNAGHVPLSQVDCAAWGQTWDGQCKFNNLNVLSPYATGSASASVAGSSCAYSFPLGFSCSRNPCYGGTFSQRVNARWNVPPTSSPAGGGSAPSGGSVSDGSSSAGGAGLADYVARKMSGSEFQKRTGSKSVSFTQAFSNSVGNFISTIRSWFR